MLTGTSENWIGPWSSSGGCMVSSGVMSFGELYVVVVTWCTGC